MVFCPKKGAANSVGKFGKLPAKRLNKPPGIGYKKYIQLDHGFSQVAQVGVIVWSRVRVAERKKTLDLGGLHGTFPLSVLHTLYEDSRYPYYRFFWVDVCCRGQEVIKAIKLAVPSH